MTSGGQLRRTHRVPSLTRLLSRLSSSPFPHIPESGMKEPTATSKSPSPSRSAQQRALGARSTGMTDPTEKRPFPSFQMIEMYPPWHLDSPDPMTRSWSPSPSRSMFAAQETHPSMSGSGREESSEKTPFPEFRKISPPGFLSLPWEKAGSQGGSSAPFKTSTSFFPSPLQSKTSTPELGTENAKDGPDESPKAGRPFSPQPKAPRRRRTQRTPPPGLWTPAPWKELTIFSLFSPNSFYFPTRVKCDPDLLNKKWNPFHGVFRTQTKERRRSYQTGRKPSFPLPS